MNNLTTQTEIKNTVVELIRADITEQNVDAIVNAANAHLAGGGGVDGAIHRRGGTSIMQETREKYPNGCPTGSAVATKAGNLPAKYVFHAVGPRWNNGTNGEPEKLHSAYKTCLELAVKHQCKSIAFPSISTGVYGYPIDQAAKIAIQTVIDFLNNKETETKFTLQLVRFCLFSENDLNVYADILQSQTKQS
ncbi:MAG: O-acetyl-ADP-ribose deacetylase [Planctomycetaceae bacterium]|jgi:O-acetyl-ADP-ribose deacetylase (regulator of RNase III)|nr:O-acetyl-ADP-ribose deacetylase [Planctomycetaceae bacterium]